MYGAMGSQWLRCSPEVMTMENARRVALRREGLVTKPV